MKKYIYKINQYLLENYPTIWNTKLVWMTLVSLTIHLIFFVLGYFALTNPEQLHRYGARDIFFENGTIFFSVIISILMFVIWFVYLFKNNSFKNFYPTSRGKLFAQFISYVFILFVGSTFYITYTYGVKAYIKNKYPETRMAKEIQTANDAATFFSHNINYYEIDERRYPFPFENTYWEKASVVHYKPYMSWLDADYQLYSVKTKELKDDQKYVNSIYNGYVYYIKKDSSRVYFYKDSVVNLLNYKEAIQSKKVIDTSSSKPKKVFFKGKYIKVNPRVLYQNQDDLAVPSYYNYSSIFYSNEEDLIYYDSKYLDELDYDYNKLYTAEKIARSKRVYELLKRNNPEEIKKLLSDFLSMANSHKIDYNINADQWFKLVYNPNRFEVDSLIRTEPNPYEYFNEAVADETVKEKFVREHLTNYYIKTDDLRAMFGNIDDIKISNSFLDSLHFFIWFSFILATLIFIFRISGIKELIFSVVAGGLIAMFIGMMTILFEYLGVLRGYQAEEYFALYFSIFIISAILLITLSYTDKLKKLVMSVFVNLSLAGFVTNVFLIIALITLHQQDTCRDYTYEEPCVDLMDWIGGENLSFLLFAVGIVFVYFYTGIIKKWKGAPEG